VKGKNGKYDFANTMKKRSILCKYTYMKQKFCKFTNARPERKSHIKSGRKIKDSVYFPNMQNYEVIHL
jgi:hypothetical protein